MDEVLPAPVYVGNGMWMQEIPNSAILMPARAEPARVVAEVEAAWRNPRPWRSATPVVDDDEAGRAG